MQIRSRLTLQFTLLVSGILMVAFVSLYIVDQNHTQQEFYQRLRDKAITSVILLLKVEKVDSALLKVIDLSKRDVLFRENISIFNEDRKSIYTNNDSLDFFLDDNIFKSIVQGTEVRFTQGEFDVLGLRFRDRGQNYIVIAGAIDRVGQSQLKYLRQLLIIQFVCLVAIVAIAGWVYSGRALRPIQKVMNEVQAISSINLTQRVQGEDKPDEIGKLVKIFNSMLSRIENAFTLQKTFVANVSHELKNPLTKITSQLEVTLLNERSNTEYQETIQSVLDDIRELNQLSNSLLDLASLNRDSSSFTMTRTRIDEIVWDVRESIQEMNKDYRMELNAFAMPENEEDLYVVANPYLLKTAIINIVENACKFSEDHTAVVSLACTKTEIELKILDNGPGIENHELENVFQPFYRTDNTAKVKGYGIGLSLSQRIISIHNGTVKIESQIGRGTLVTIVFKRSI